MNPAIRMAWGAAALIIVSGCAQPGTPRGGPHAGMSHGAVSSGTAGNMDQAGCPMKERDHQSAEHATKEGQPPADAGTGMGCRMMNPAP